MYVNQYHCHHLKELNAHEENDSKMYFHLIYNQIRGTVLRRYSQYGVQTNKA